MAIFTCDFIKVLAFCFCAVLPNNIVWALQKGKIVSFFQDTCATTLLNPCQQVCTDIPSGGFYCQCEDGFIINKDGMTCREHSGAQPDSRNGAETSVSDGRPDNHNYLNRALFKSTNPSKEVNSVDKEITLSDSSVVHIYSTDLKKGLPPLESSSYTRRLKTDSGVVLDRDFYSIPEGGSRDHYSISSDLDIIEGGVHSSPFKHSNEWGLPSIQKELTPQTKGKELCDKVVCENNGTCAVMESRAVCQCSLGTDGEQCERVIDVKYPKLVGTGYLSLPIFHDSNEVFIFSLEFNPESPNGLLLFSEVSSDSKMDSFSVVLEDSFVIYRFVCGAGEATLKSSNRVTLADWNKLTITRQDTRGTLQLNTEHQMEGYCQGNSSESATQRRLYLGGYRDMPAISSHVSTLHQFVGCIQEIAVGVHKWDLSDKQLKGQLFGVNVGECSEHVCDEASCVNGGICTAKSADQHVCLCPLGFHGEKCQNDSPVHIPHFSGQSYLEFPGLERSVLSYTEIEIVFKPTSGEGILFYNGYSKDRGGDFISLSLHDGYLEFRFDLGTGPAVIRSSEPLAKDTWYLIRASRTGLMGTLDIDGQTQKTGQAEGAYTQLTLLDGLYLGGHPDYDHTSRHANITKSFTGCLQKVAVNKQALNLMSGAVSGVGVSPCSHPCTGRPCMNSGDCRPYLDTYICSCPIGFGNTNCEEVQEFLPNKPMFKGESYLVYKDKEITKRVAGHRMDLQIYIRPRGRDGLIFWSGEGQNSKSSRDYISLGFNGGSLQLRYNLGSGEALIGYNDSKIFDGRWHFVRVQRDKQTSYMEVDKKEIVEGSSPGGYTSLNTNKLVYLGGMPNIAEKTGGRYTMGYVGCIRGLRLATDYDVKLLVQAHSGRNVDQCRKKIFS